jgi:hypothetical protein
MLGSNFIWNLINQKSTHFLDAAPRSPVEAHWNFGGIYCLCLQSQESCFSHNSILKMEAISSLESLVDLCRIIWHCISEDAPLDNDRSWKITSYSIHRSGFIYLSEGWGRLKMKKILQIWREIIEEEWRLRTYEGGEIQGKKMYSIFTIYAAEEVDCFFSISEKYTASIFKVESLRKVIKSGYVGKVRGQWLVTNMGEGGDMQNPPHTL